VQVSLCEKGIAFIVSEDVWHQPVVEINFGVVRDGGYFEVSRIIFCNRFCILPEAMLGRKELSEWRSLTKTGAQKNDYDQRD